MEAPSAVAVQRPLFDYGDLTPPNVKRCESAAEKIRKCQRRMAGDIIAIGGELLAVKERLEHGQFGEWIRHYFGWSHQTCCSMMNAATTFSEIPNFGNLTIDTSALYLLSSEKCPDETREDFLERAEQGEHITHAAVKQALDGEKEPLSFEDRIDRVIATIRKLSRDDDRGFLRASLKLICEELEEDE